MTSDQYTTLLEDLARAGGLSDPRQLVANGRVKVGDVNVLLEHDVQYDPDLLQVRMLLGGTPSGMEDISRALLEANYISGYGGECVFSLLPQSDDVVVTMRLRLADAMSAQELWQELSDIARHGSGMWEQIVAAAEPSAGSLQAARV